MNDRHVTVGELLASHYDDIALDKFALCYAKAWCCQDPEKVAAFCWVDAFRALSL